MRDFVRNLVPFALVALAAFALGWVANGSREAKRERGEGRPPSIAPADFAGEVDIRPARSPAAHVGSRYRVYAVNLDGQVRRLCDPSGDDALIITLAGDRVVLYVERVGD